MKITLKTVRPEPVEGLSFYFARRKGKAGLRQAQPERYVINYGEPGNRSTLPGPGAAAGPRPALGATRGAAPDEKARGGAAAAAQRPPERLGEAFHLLDLRQCRYVRPLQHLLRPAPRRQELVRGRGGRRPLGARPLAAVSRPLPRPWRAPVGAGRGAAGGSRHRHARKPRRRRRHR